MTKHMLQIVPIYVVEWVYQQICRNILSHMKKKPKLGLKTLELLGLKEKDLTIYTTLLQLGSAPLRKVAEEAGFNRGTTYDTLKRLKSVGLVSYVDAKSHRYFVAEDPQKLRGLATRREVALQEARQKIDDLLPQFRNLAGIAKYRPAVKYFEGAAGVKDVLRDVLSVTAQQKDKMYRVYSSSGIRDLIAISWPRWNAERKRRGVFTRAIAMDEGGQTHGLDERRWLGKQKGGAPTYIFIYGDRTAYVSVDKREQLFGVIIEDEAISSTQRLIFDALWQNLGWGTTFLLQS